MHALSTFTFLLTLLTLTTSLPLDPPLDPLDPSFLDPTPQTCNAACRRAFCASISRFLESASCGRTRVPCLSLSLQEEVNTKCLTWRSRKDSLAWTSTEEQQPPPEDGESTWIGSRYTLLLQDHLRADEAEDRFWTGERVWGGASVWHVLVWIVAAGTCGYCLGFSRRVAMAMSQAPTGIRLHGKHSRGLLPVIDEKEERSWCGNASE